jgi:ferredoxin
MTAAIDQKLCLNCGLCVDICPEQAISMDDTAAIDSSKCTGCGSCVNECPNDAISLAETPRRAAS